MNKYAAASASVNKKNNTNIFTQKLYICNNLKKWSNLFVNQRHPIEIYHGYIAHPKIFQCLIYPVNSFKSRNTLAFVIHGVSRYYPRLHNLE